MSSASTYLKDQLDLEDCLGHFEKDVTSTVVPRWQRKKLEKERMLNSSATPRRRREKRDRSKTPRRGLSKTPSKRRALGASPQHDRFIPRRSAMDISAAHYKMTKENANINGDVKGRDIDSKTSGEFQKTLADSMDATTSRVLAFKNKAPAPADGYQNSLKVLYSQNKSKRVMTKVHRHIASAPERILDAPDIVDDYYLNLLDWGANNVLAVALGRTVYLWNAATGGIEELYQCEGEDDYVSSEVCERGRWISCSGNE